jgi:hypothetical protein
VLLEGYEPYYASDSALASSEETQLEVETTAAADQPLTAAVRVEATADWSVDDFKSFVQEVPENPMGGGDGLEKHREWAVMNWANPAEASAWKRGQADDDVLLVVRLKGGQKDKVAIMREAELALAKTGTIRMDVYNSTSKKVDIAFAVHATVDDVYSESATQPARPGWNHLEWDLAGSTYKTEASGWKNTAQLWGGEEVKKLVILVYDSGQLTIAIDKIEADVVAE